MELSAIEGLHELWTHRVPARRTAHGQSPDAGRAAESTGIGRPGFSGSARVEAAGVAAESDELSAGELGAATLRVHAATRGCGAEARKATAPSTRHTATMTAILLSARISLPHQDWTESNHSAALHELHDQHDHRDDQ